jgi:hypothetical protein
MLLPSSLFGNVVAVAFQNTFHSEMHQNNIFFYFLKLFLTSAHQNNMKTLKKNINLKQKNKKNSIFFKSVFETQKQTGPSKL